MTTRAEFLNSFVEQFEALLNGKPYTIDWETVYWLADSVAAGRFAVGRLRLPYRAARRRRRGTS